MSRGAFRSSGHHARLHSQDCSPRFCCGRPETRSARGRHGASRRTATAAAANPRRGAARDYGRHHLPRERPHHRPLRPCRARPHDTRGVAGSGRPRVPGLARTRGAGAGQAGGARAEGVAQGRPLRHVVGPRRAATRYAALHRAHAPGSTVHERGLAASALQLLLPVVSAESAMVVERDHVHPGDVAAEGKGGELHGAPISRCLVAIELSRGRTPRC